jgi:hypothetical protein
MRLLRLLPASFVLLVSPAVIAQHSAPSSAAHTSMATSHVSSAPSSVHSSASSSAHPVGMTAAASASRGSQPVSKKNVVSAQRAQRSILPVSSTHSATSEPLKVHRFLFFRRHKPEKPKTPYPTASPTTARSTLFPVVPTPHFGCRIAPVPLNSGIPCGPLDPCCP